MVQGIGDVSRIVEANTGRAPATVEPLGSGLENVAYLADGRLVVRFLQDAARAADVELEARLLELVAGVAPLPVPRPVFADAARGCLAYERLPGVPLLDLPRTEHARAAEPVGRELGAFLRALHSIDTDLVGVDDDEPETWLADARAQYAVAGAAIPDAHTHAIERFLGAQPPARGDARVFSHNDLGIEHVLVDPDTFQVTGVIDWSDAASTDPAYDFGLILRDLGTAGLNAALAAYGAAHGIAGRAPFYARCALLEDLAYGIETGNDAYVGKSVDSLARLFK